MTKFPYEVTELTGGLFRLSFDDFPALKLFSKCHYVLRLEAAWALNALVAIRIRRGLVIPKPVEALDAIPIEEHIDFRLRLFWGMQSNGLSREDFALEMGLSTQMVDSIFDGDDGGTNSPYIEAIACQEIDSEYGNANVSALSHTPASGTAQLALLAV